MLLMQFVQWAKGWTVWEAEGGLPEEMLNRIREERIEIWRLRRTDTCLSARCYARDYKRMHRIARKTGMRLHHTEKHGAPFYVHRYRARWGIPVGILLAALLLWFLSGRIWIVSVHGAKAPLSDTICETLRPMGVVVGGAASNLYPPEIQLQALQSLPEITWLAVNMQGCEAQIYVLERKVGEPEKSTIVASNLVAARDGLIVRTEVRGGQSVVKVGEGVTAGTLLVSGVVDTKLGPVLRRAEATILADTTRELSVSVPLRQTVSLPTGKRVVQTTLSFLGLHIPLSSSYTVTGEYHLAEQAFPVVANGVSLPLGIDRRVYTLLAPTAVTYTEDEALTLAREMLARREQEELAAVTVRTREESVRTENGTLILDVTYACTEDIAEERPILVE